MSGIGAVSAREQVVRVSRRERKGKKATKLTALVRCAVRGAFVLFALAYLSVVGAIIVFSMIVNPVRLPLSWRGY